MSFIQWHAGCGNQPGCFGPREGFVTIFNTELRFLFVHAIVAVLLGLGLLTLLYKLKKNQKISWSTGVIIVVSILATVFLFLLFALIFPVRVFY